VGRRKTYDRDEIAEKAMRLFWANGYHATSTRDLTEAMQINPYSLYAEFGSKEGLYEAAIARYEAIVVQKHFGALEVDGASLEQIRGVLDFFGDNGTRAGSQLGCLLTNASTEQAPSPEKSELSTARFVDRLTRAFRNALCGMEAEGRLMKGAPVDELAAFFPTVLIGIFVLSRARVQPAVLRGAADQALRRLDTVTDPSGVGTPGPGAL
jgi:TetR/AcrR family transcriptional regulator, transcriptional repressor for nem operon